MVLVVVGGAVLGVFLSVFFYIVAQEIKYILRLTYKKCSVSITKSPLLGSHPRNSIRSSRGGARASFFFFFNLPNIQPGLGIIE